MSVCYLHILYQNAFKMMYDSLESPHKMAGISPFEFAEVNQDFFWVKPEKVCSWTTLPYANTSLEIRILLVQNDIICNFQFMFDWSILP